MKTANLVNNNSINTWTLKDVGDHWDSVIDYDDINKKTYSYFRRFIDGYRMASVKDHAYLLDICCRTGNGTWYFARKKKNRLRSVCMDPSRRFVDAASKRLSASSVDFKAAQFLELPLKVDGAALKNRIFDNIICFESLEHMPEPKAFLAELNRILKDDGEMLITTPNLLWEPIHWFAEKTGLHHSEGPSAFLPRKKVIMLLKKAGFRIIKEKTTVLIPYGPEFLTTFGRNLEAVLGESIMQLIGLRRLLICRKRL